MFKIVYEVWKFFAPFLKPYKFQCLFLVILPAIWCLVETAAPFLIKIVIDYLFALHSSDVKEAEAFLSYIFIGYTSCIFILEISTRLCGYVWVKTFPLIRSSIQVKTLEKIQTHSFEDIYNEFTGSLSNKYRTLTDSFENIAKILLYNFYPAILSFLFSLIFIHVISGFFSLVFLAWFICMIFITIFFLQNSITASKECSKAQNILIGYVSNFLSNVIALIVFPRMLAEESHISKAIQYSFNSKQALEYIALKADTWRSLCSGILFAGMILFLGYGWKKNWITIGDFSFVAAVCFYVRRSIWAGSIQLIDFFKELGTLHEALSFVERTPIYTNKSIYSDSSLPINNQIDFCNVTFSYDKHKNIFKDFNLCIPPGQKIGIFGDSGSGKTSLTYLLLRLYNPTQGKIVLGNQNISNLSLEQLRSLFSYVPQHASLLHQSIYENIAFGKPGASRDEVYEAAHICLCEEFIELCENGYDTIIGEGGYKLSGGQLQRLAIARAFIKKAPIFILDEALSGVEPSLEKRILDSLCLHLKEHTFILTSHRTAGLLKMDRVIELQHGNIIQDRSTHIFSEKN